MKTLAESKFSIIFTSELKPTLKKIEIMTVFELESVLKRSNHFLF
jgi:hypothetical protein